jgi:aspartate/methionine/tyrosine aminotransferase
MFSARTRWDRTVNRLARLLEQKRRTGATLLDLTESNPTRAGLPYPDDLLSALSDPAGRRYEPAPAGLAAARRAVALDHARRGTALDPGRLLLTASTSEAYALLFKLLCDPGDQVAVPRPSYPLFDFLAQLEAVEVVRYPLRYDGAWAVDLEALGDAATERTRAVVVVHPNNPTGSYLKQAEAERLLALCAERGLALIADEVFADYSLAPAAGRWGSFACDGPALAFALGGLSKSCGLPQLKLAWIAVAGPARLREEALARLEIVADTFLSVGTPVQHAAAPLLARRPELQGPIADRLRTNLDQLRRRVAGAPASLLTVEGGWYAVLQVPRTLSEEERVLRLLERRDVLVHPGYFFDFESEAFLVLSLLPAPATFAESVDRLVAELVV